MVVFLIPSCEIRLRTSKKDRQDARKLTTVPRSTGNCAAVSIVVVQSVFSPVQNAGAEMEGLWELLFGAATWVLIN